jgi:hypothetical protein
MLGEGSNQIFSPSSKITPYRGCNAVPVRGKGASNIRCLYGIKYFLQQASFFRRRKILPFSECARAVHIRSAVLTIFPAACN